MAQAKREVAAQVKKAAPRATAERADEDQAGADYVLCLERYAKVLAFGAIDEHWRCVNFPSQVALLW
jgi:hypothetical protein